MPQFTRKQIIAIAKCIRNSEIPKQHCNKFIIELDKLFFEDNASYAAQMFKDIAQFKKEEDPITHRYLKGKLL